MRLPVWAMKPVKPIYRNVAVSFLVPALFVAFLMTGIPAYLSGAVADWYQERKVTPESALEQLRMFEELRIYGTASKRGWFLTTKDSSKDDKRGTLVVIDEGKQNATRDEARKTVTTPENARNIVCSLLLPPFNLKQELFTEVEVWNRWKVGDGTPNEWVAAANKECPREATDAELAEPRGRVARCIAYEKVAGRLINIPRLHRRLPIDPKVECSVEDAPRSGLHDSEHIVKAAGPGRR